MNTRTGGRELVRAVALGLCCEMFRVFREVKERGKVDSLVLGGGASRGGFFRAMLAALFAPLPVYQPRDEDFAGARGTLHAFGASAPRVAPRRVPVPERGIRDRIARALDLYLEVFERVYGGVALGGPIRFRSPS
jgi:sugar (pentulose or hexulose) kinase